MNDAEEKASRQRPLKSDDADKTELLTGKSDATKLLVEGTGPVATWRDDVSVNTVLLGRFKLVQLVGEGGMSDVYKAIDLRKVEAGARDPYLAVKVLTVRLDDYFSSLAVMHHEASKLQTLTHPNIVRVIDCDRDGNTVFMTMEYLDGTPLKLKMPRNASDDHRLPRDEALRIVTSMGEALEFAHGKHIVHGDLKPGNVIVTAAGDVKVIDFGIARFVRRSDEEIPSDQEWHSDFSALTPPYASPEMHDGADPDPRDDIFALGCIAYELLVGQHPFGRVASIKAREAGLIVPVSKLLRAHEHRALVNALQFDRARRTPTARQFLDELIARPKKLFSPMLLLAAAAVFLIVAALYFGHVPLGSQTTATPASDAALATRALVAPGEALTPGALFRDCPTCPLMVVLAPAIFVQGTLSDAEGALPFEQPAHSVTLAAPLAAGITEVTVGQFAEFAKEYPRARNGCHVYDGTWRERGDTSWENATADQTTSYPVTCVNWQEATDYAAWLSLRTGASYRLPSASEWEYLAQAGAPNAARSNAGDVCAGANVADVTAAKKFPGWSTFTCDDRRAETAPVGSFAPNAFGLNDTLGNVFEWTQDCWRDDYTDAPTDGSAVLADDCRQREARGGSWFTPPAFIRAAYRNRFDANFRGSSVGFRLVREIKNEK